MPRSVPRTTRRPVTVFGRERGAVAIIVALAALVLFGMTAYVIDVGALYQERRELQTGADAAALAIARDCALGDCADYNATAHTYVEANSSDGTATVAGIDFPPTDRVRVRDEGSVDYTFARVFGKDSSVVHATATAMWGSPASATSRPLVFSLCEFTGALGPPSPTPPPYPPERFDPPVPHVIYFHTGNNNPQDHDCAAQAGQDTDGNGKLDGGFGWLDSDGCAAKLNLADGAYWAHASTGAAPPNDCEPAQLLDKDLLLPIFDDVIDGNSPGWANQCARSPKKCYRVYGFAGFHVTGFRFPGAGAGWSGGVSPCTAPLTCIGGYFIRFVPSAEGATPGGVDLGAYIVKLVE